ncbi:hypothetical protein DRO58_02750, partial [Candidatus Bathyarchaeota archaeon]
VDTDVYVDAVDLSLESGDVNYRSFLVKLTEAVPFPSSGVDQSCLLYLPMDEGSGETVYDKSSYRNEGTVYGATWVDGKYGKALYFDGVDDYVEVDNADILNVVEALTVEIWAKTLSLDNTWRCLASKHYCYWSIKQTSSNLFRFQVYTVNGADSIYFEPKPDTWYHLVMVYHKDAGLEAFVNGNSVGKDATYLGDLKLTYGETAPLRIGQDPAVASQFFKGIIDDVRVYNRALTEDEVHQLYLSGAARIAAKSLIPTHIEAEFEIAGSRQPAFESGYVEKLMSVGLKRIWRLECIEKGVPWDYSAARYLQYKAWKGKPVEFKARMNDRYETEEVEAYITGITVDLIDIDSNIRKFTVELREA